MIQLGYKKSSRLMEIVIKIIDAFYMIIIVLFGRITKYEDGYM